MVCIWCSSIIRRFLDCCVHLIEGHVEKVVNNSNQPTSISATIVGGPYDGQVKELTLPRADSFILIYETCMMTSPFSAIRSSTIDVDSTDGAVKYNIVKRADNVYRLVREVREVSV
jgi:hypothetical protein